MLHCLTFVFETERRDFFFVLPKYITANMDSNNPSRIFYRITIEPPNIVHPYKSHEDSLNSRKNFDFPTNLNVFTPLDFLETKLSTFVNQLLDVDFFFWCST